MGLVKLPIGAAAPRLNLRLASILLFGLASCSLGFPKGTSDTAAPVLTNNVAHARDPRTVVFSGDTWLAKRSRRPVGPGPNVFSEENVEVDSGGRLHLRIVRRANTWTSAEIGSSREFGYGTFRFSVLAAPIDPRAILGLFTWDDGDSDFHHREIDIEIGRWGDARSRNAQCVVQPARQPGNMVRFEMPDGPAVHEFTWSRNGVSCLSRVAASSGSAAFTTVVHQHQFRGSSPKGGAAKVRINLWLADGLPPSQGTDVEALIERFEFIPES
jgi:hypothetical protein